MIIEWRDSWNALDQIESHFVFYVLPTDAIPLSTFSNRKSQCEAMRSNPVIPSDADVVGWFNVHKPHKDESDVQFEHRMIRTLASLLRAIAKWNMQPQPSTP